MPSDVRPSESGRYAADSPRRSHSVPPSQAMIWIGAASAPSCGLGGFRGRQRSAISPSAWDGRLRRVAQAWPGLSVRSERDTCGRVRRAGESCRTAAARSGIFGWTIRDASCLPLDGRRNSADPIKPPRQSHAHAALRPACGCDGGTSTRLGVSCARPLGRVLGAPWPEAIRWLESDLRSGQRREHRPNVPALVLRRRLVVASGRLYRPLGMVKRS